MADLKTPGWGIKGIELNSDRIRPLVDALNSTDPRARALVMEIEALEPGAIQHLTTANDAGV